MRGNYSTKPSSLTSRLVHETLKADTFKLASVGYSNPLDKQTITITHQDPNTKPTLVVSTQTLDNQHDTLSHDTALSILHDTAQALGLDRHDVDNILPTVEKLVKVIVNHVPLLEQFVNHTCQIVLGKESNKLMDETLTKKGRPVLKAKKKRMKLALDTLQKRWDVPTVSKDHGVNIEAKLS